MQSDWATIEIDGVQHIVHRRPASANFSAHGARRLHGTAREQIMNIRSWRAAPGPSAPRGLGQAAQPSASYFQCHSLTR
jgi:hypothetical protein